MQRQYSLQTCFLWFNAFPFWYRSHQWNGLNTKHGVELVCYPLWGSAALSRSQSITGTATGTQPWPIFAPSFLPNTDMSNTIGMLSQMVRLRGGALRRVSPSLITGGGGSKFTNSVWRSTGSKMPSCFRCWLNLPERHSKAHYLEEVLWGKR